MASLPDAADVPALTAFINGCRASFNVDQAALFDAVMTAVDSFVAGDDAPEGGRIFFVQAFAGTGSSASFTSGRTRQNAVLACLCHLRSRGRPILRWQNCSPRVYGLPVPCDTKSCSGIGARTDRANLLRLTALHIIDEAVMLNWLNFNLIDT